MKPKILALMEGRGTELGAARLTSQADRSSAPWHSRIPHMHALFTDMYLSTVFKSLSTLFKIYHEFEYAIRHFIMNREYTDPALSSQLMMNTLVFMTHAALLLGRRRTKAKLEGPPGGGARTAVVYVRDLTSRDTRTAPGTRGSRYTYP